MRRLIVGGACVLSAALSGSAFAAASAPSTVASPRTASSFYYEIGGALPFSLSPTNVARNWSAGAELKTHFSCGRFDISGSLTNAFANIAGDIQTTIANGAQAAIAALPAYIIHRANPDLYDTIQNAILRIDGIVSASTKTCQQIEADMAANPGANPFDDLIKVTAAADWRLKMGSGADDIVTGSKSVAADLGKNGISWVGGVKKGGTNGTTIKPVGDTISAGWNMVQGRAADNATAYNAAGIGNAIVANDINNYWNDPASASNWIRSVIGDIESSTTNGGTRDSFAGLGLGYELRGTVDGVQINLQDLVRGTNGGGAPINPTEINLRNVSAPGLAITRHVIEAIRRQSQFEQPVTISRLSGEIAMARVLDEALLARQLLITGKQEPNIMASGLANTVIDPAIKRLDEAIENVMFESKLRQTVVSSTVLKIIDHDEANLKRSAATPTSTDSDPKPLGTGGVVR